jgi:hypothetical protein
MFRLSEDSFLAICLGDCEVIPVGAVEGHQSRFGDPSKGKDVGDAVGTKPCFTLSWNGSSQFRNRFSSLGMNRQASSYLVHVS